MIILLLFNKFSRSADSPADAGPARGWCCSLAAGKKLHGASHDRCCALGVSLLQQGVLVFSEALMHDAEVQALSGTTAMTASWCCPRPRGCREGAGDVLEVGVLAFSEAVGVVGVLVLSEAVRVVGKV